MAQKLERCAQELAYGKPVAVFRTVMESQHPDVSCEHQGTGVDS
jgi:hypothetical protein